MPEVPCEAEVIEDVTYHRGTHMEQTLRAGSTVTVKGFYHGGTKRVESNFSASCEAAPGTPDLGWTHRADGIHNLGVPYKALRFKL